MVTITSTTPQQSIYTALSGASYFPVSVVASITETSPALTRVGASLDWNDGTPPVIFTPGKIINVNLTRNLAIGTYYIELAAFNYAQPQPQQASSYFTVLVQPQQLASVPQTYLFGPILPKDSGYPNAAQWNFDSSTNLDVLASSVKMLLITTKGERIMLPSYGTLLRRIIFEPSSDTIGSIIQQEITDALAQFEPRVGLDSFNFQKLDSGGRSYLVNAVFVSKINQSSFALALPFSQ